MNAGANQGGRGAGRGGGSIGGRGAGARGGLGGGGGFGFGAEASLAYGGGGFNGGNGLGFNQGRYMNFSQGYSGDDGFGFNQGGGEGCGGGESYGGPSGSLAGQGFNPGYGSGVGPGHGGGRRGFPRGRGQRGFVPRRGGGARYQGRGQSAGFANRGFPPKVAAPPPNAAASASVWPPGSLQLQASGAVATHTGQVGPQGPLTACKPVILAQTSQPASVPSALAIAPHQAVLMTAGKDALVGDKGTMVASKANFQEAPQKPSKAPVGRPGLMPGNATIQGENEGGPSKANAKKKYCWRCATKGHAISSCKAVLCCDICDSDEHVAYKCPVLKDPHPVAHSVGYAAEDLGFYHIPYAPLSDEDSDQSTALVKVVGGSISVDQLTGHLHKLVPGDWVWVVEELDNNSYVVPFPSQAELQRTMAYGGAVIKELGVRLIFEEYEDVQCGLPMPKVWVRVKGLPKKLRKYQILWALGSMFGATQKVDMETTKCSTFGRVFVAVLNSDLIPNQMDVVIGDHYFELKFVVEQNTLVNVPSQMDTDDNGQEDDGNDQDQNPGNNFRDYKRAKNGVENKGKVVSSNDSVSGDQVVQGQESSSAQEGLVSHSIIHNMVEKILDLEVDKLLMEGADEILAEEEDGLVVEASLLVEEARKDALEAECPFSNDFVLQELTGSVAPPSVEVAGGLVISHVESQALGLEGEQGPNVSGGELQLPSSFDRPPVGGLAANQQGIVVSHVLEAVALQPAQGGAVPWLAKEAFKEPGRPRAIAGQRSRRGQSVPVCPTGRGLGASPARRSKRRADSVDEDSVERAARLVAKRNLEFNDGYLQRYILVSLLVAIAEGGGPSFHSGYVPTSGNYCYGDFCQPWVAVQQ